LLGPRYEAEFVTDFTDEDVKEIILRMKNNIATGLDGRRGL
jgi:hypothetical protein